MLEWIVVNKELIKIVYGVMAMFICLVIVLKSHKLFHLSLHQGIRYFRNAFFFFGIALAIRYIIAAYGYYYPTTMSFYYVTKALFEFFIIMAGFFLFYSLLWKKIEISGKHHFSSLFNPVIILLYIMTLLIVTLDFLWGRYYFMFFSQIILFIFVSGVSYPNYLNDRGRHFFPRFYFIAMFLSLVVWTLNALASLIFKWHPWLIIIIYSANIIVFLLFLFGVINATKYRG